MKLEEPNSQALSTPCYTTNLDSYRTDSLRSNLYSAKSKQHFCGSFQDFQSQMPEWFQSLHAARYTTLYHQNKD